MPDAGLIEAGAGSVNFWASRQNAASGLVSSLLNTVVGGLLTKSSGAAYWDDGTLSNRLYAGSGLRLLSVLEAPLVWLNPSLLHRGDLNLLGLTNPLASIHPKWLQYGNIGDLTEDQMIIWGTQMHDVDGQMIIWGTSGDDAMIIWGTTETSPDAR
jgi:hypothetical protein